MIRIAEITFSRLRAFQLSQTKKPIPIPPESISPATITNHATPMLSRRPVMMCGRLNGNKAYWKPRERRNRFEDLNYWIKDLFTKCIRSHQDPDWNGKEGAQ